MGMLDDIKNKVEDVLHGGQEAAGDARTTGDKIGDKIDEAVDKATDKVDDLTGGKSADVTQKVDDAVDKATDHL